MKRLFKRHLIAAVVIVFSMLGGAFAYQNFHGVRESKSETHPARSALAINGSELFVRAFPIELESKASSRMQFTGTLQPRFQTPVGFRVAGKIVERCVDVGQRVDAGQILFRMDSTDFELQLRMSESELISAKALLHQATAEERRLSQLRKAAAVSQSEYDLALSTKEVAAARLDAAERKLRLSQNQRNYCDLFADQSGQVTAIQAEVGQVVNIGQPVLQMMQGCLLEAVVPIPENMLEDAKKLDGKATFWSKPSLVLSANLRELSPSPDPVTRTYDARFQLESPPEELTIGMTVSIRLAQENTGEIQVPIQSISSKENRPMVWRIKPDQTSSIASLQVEAVPIEIVRYSNTTASIRANLSQGDQIVSSGVQRIDEDCRVYIWKGQ